MLYPLFAIGGAIGAAYLDSRHADKALSIRGVTLEPGTSAGAALGVLGIVTGSTALLSIGAGGLAFEAGSAAKARFLPALPAQPAAVSGVPGFSSPNGLGLPSPSYASLSDQEVWQALSDLTRQGQAA